MPPPEFPDLKDATIKSGPAPNTIFGMPTNRELLLRRIMPEFLYDLTLSPSALRSHGTTAGMILGSYATPVVGTAIGGMLGNLVVQGAQHLLPEIFGEPPETNAFGTAAADTALSAAGGVAGKGLVFGGKLAGKTLSKAKDTLTPSSRKELAAKVFSMVGESPASRIIRDPLKPEISRTPELKIIEKLHEEGMPLSIAQIQGSPTLLAMQNANRTGKEFLHSQERWIEDRAKQLLAPVTNEKSWRPFKLNEDLDAAANIFRRRVKIDESNILPPAIDPYSMNPAKELLKTVSSLPEFREFQKKVGADKSRQTLIKLWFEDSFEQDVGRFNAAKLGRFLRNHQSIFNEAAKDTEKATNGAVKATDLKAAWNRFMAATSIASRGSKIGGRALEVEATNAGLAALAAIPTIGIGNYPTARAAATFSKLGFIGPRLTKAMTDPEMIQEFIKLQNAQLNSPAHQSAMKSFVRKAVEKGIPLSMRNAAGTWIDVQLNPKTMKIMPVGPSEQVIEEEENPWNFLKEGNPSDDNSWN